MSNLAIQTVLYLWVNGSISYETMRAWFLFFGGPRLL